MTITPTNWIKAPDCFLDGLLEVTLPDGIPLPVETHNVHDDEVEMNVPQTFFMLLESINPVELYTDEDDYYAKQDGTSMASESIIPCGLFPAEPNENFVQNPTVILNGVVTKVLDSPQKLGFSRSDTVFEVTCLGHEFGAVAHDGSLDRKPTVGNIVSSCFLLQGWPQEEH